MIKTEQGGKRYIYLGLLVLFLTIAFVAYFVVMPEGMISVFQTKKLVVPNDTSSLSWEEVKVLAQQCDVAQLVDGHMGDGAVLKDGRSFLISGSLGYGEMMRLTQSVKSKCGHISVGAE